MSYSIDPALVAPGEHFHVNVKTDHAGWVSRYVRCVEVAAIRPVHRPAIFRSTDDLSHQIAADNGAFERGGKTMRAIMEVLDLNYYSGETTVKETIVVDMKCIDKHRPRTPEQIHASNKAADQRQSEKLGAKRAAKQPQIDLINAWAKRNGYLVGGIERTGMEETNFRIDRPEAFIDPTLTGRNLDAAKDRFRSNQTSAMYADPAKCVVEVPTEIMGEMLAEIEQLRVDAYARGQSA